MGDFVRVLKASELPPGEMRLVEAGGVDVVVANVGGTICAFGNSCPHSEGPLCEGELVGEVVTCPWHFTRFNIRTGAVIEGETDEPITLFEVRVTGDDIEIGDRR